MSKIISFRANDVLRLEVVEINPKGNVVRITGKNDQGKTSCLDAIMATFGGKSVQPTKMLRAGAKSGSVKIGLDSGLVITKRITDKDTYLELAAADGAVYKSPQAMLDKMFSDNGRALMFDPLAFSRLDAAGQLKTLRELCGVDTVEIDSRIAGVRDKRRDANRDAANARAAADALPSAPEGTPEAEVDPAEVMAKLNEINAHNQAIDNADASVIEARRALQSANNHLMECEERVRQAKTAADAANSNLGQRTRALTALGVKKDPGVCTQELNEAKGINANVRARAAKLKATAEAAGKETTYRELDTQVQQLQRDREAMLAAAKMPIDGLAITDEGIAWKGIPFDQSSQSTRVKVSAAIGIAMLPDRKDAVRVMLVRDGSLLDEDSKNELFAMVEAADVQLWMEETTDGEPIGVVIHEGKVKEFSGHAADVAEKAGA